MKKPSMGEFATFVFAVEAGMKKIEVITLKEAMQGVSENQTRMAALLGINRGTLRKYLKGNVGEKLLEVERNESENICGLKLINNCHGE